MPRFVVLRHQPPAASKRILHWDFMLEFGGALRTWALASEPAMDATIDCQQLPDHRLVYLDYEGPIAGDRGSVSRWDAGTFDIVLETQGELRITLKGCRLQGAAHLRRGPDSAHRWKVAFSSCKWEPDR